MDWLLSLDQRTVAITVLGVVVLSILTALIVGAELARRDRPLTMTGKPRDLDGKVVPMRRPTQHRPRSHRRGDAAIVILLILVSSCSSPTAPRMDGVVGNGGGYQTGHGVGWP